jgi:ZIP family zinc transporter
MEALGVAAAASGTALATGVGVLPVAALGPGAVRLRATLAGVAIGAMAIASLVGLLLPAARDGSAVAVVGGAVVGGFVAFARAALSADRYRERIGTRVRGSLLVFGVLLVHSLPEGFAIGAAWASGTAGLGLFIVLAIGLQNVPEGTAVAIPMEAAGFGRTEQIWAAIASSLPQPVGALGAYLLVDQVRSVLPVSLAFAAGAMLTVIVLELLPAARRGDRAHATAGAIAGGTAMLALSAVLGI